MYIEHVILNISTT